MKQVLRSGAGQCSRAVRGSCGFGVLCLAGCKQERRAVDGVAEEKVGGAAGLCTRSRKEYVRDKMEAGTCT